MSEFERISAARKEAQANGSFPHWYTTQAYQMFQAKYSVEGEDGFKGRARTISRHLSKYLPNAKRWEERFYEIIWNNTFSPASPVLANTGTRRGFNVSCSGQKVGDGIDQLYRNIHETAMLTKLGFGCSVDLTSVRHRGAPISVGGTADGPVEFAEAFWETTGRVSQGENRRGSIAAYMDIEAPDFDEMCDLVESEPTGRNIGWTIRDTALEKLRANDEEMQRRFIRAMFLKLVTGRGYFFKIDEANRKRPVWYKDLGLEICATNLCTEIMLHSSELLTYTCVLSSMNLATYDEWKDTDAIYVATVFLDCVVSDFLNNAEGTPGMEKALEFTRKGRAIGLGVLGFSTLLQKRRIAFEDNEARDLNDEIFKKLHDESQEASQWLAAVLGEPEWMKGYGMRNTHRTALAPTKSTALLMGGISESTFPDPGMVWDAGSAAGEMRRINSVFFELMKERGQYSQETVRSIIDNLGSVAHLEWLTPHEKRVFRGAFEVNQDKILEYAERRQKWLCQGQSLNFYFGGDAAEERIAEVFSKALMSPDILSIYYLYSRQGTVISSECSACES